jgi:hypothetical protein
VAHARRRGRLEAVGALGYVNKAVKDWQFALLL